MDEKKFQQDGKSHTKILLSLLNKVLYDVVDYESASGLWIKLDSLYVTNTLFKQVLNQTMLVLIKYEICFHS